VADHSPYEQHYAEVAGARVHYVDEGSGPPLLLLHGNPTWSFLYRDVIAGLRDRFRCIAPDYPGFGRSDKPTDLAWYSYDRHVEQVTGVLDTLELSGATVVVQDWGGPIGLRWAVEHADRVDRLVIMNTGLFTGRVSKGFLKWREFAEKNPDLPVGMVLQGATATDLDPAVVAAYEAPFPDAASKAGAATFPLLVPIEESAPGAAEMTAVMDALSRWEKPVLVAFSDSDPVFPSPKAGQVFVDLIPGAGEQVVVEGGGHFLQEDRGDVIAAAILEWIDTGGSRPRPPGGAWPAG
jgi:haloalkane dehalogenase